MLKARDWKQYPSDLEPGCLNPDDATVFKAIKPQDFTFFSSFFGPLFPELVHRTWILYGSPLLRFPFDLEPDRGSTIAEIESIYKHIFTTTTYGSVVTNGQFLVRTANHLQEFDDQFYGLPIRRLTEDQLTCLSTWDPSSAQLPVSLFRSVDICFSSYEGIWTLYSQHDSLLKRIKRHAEPLAHISPASGQLDSMCPEMLL